MARTETAVLLVLVDGLRHDYLDPADAPFLHALGRNNWTCRLRETYAFELRPAFLAGLQPEECGIANMFLYDPEQSPFAGLDLEGLDRAAIDRAAKEAERRRGHTASAHFAFSAAIPRALLPRFAFSEKRLTWEQGSLGARPTLFDHLRRAGKKWLWLAYPDGDLRAGPLFQDFRARLEPDHALIFLHFAELDWVGHQAGPESAARRDKLREIDATLERIFAHLNGTRGELRALVFGDHGMAPVERTADIGGLLAANGLVPGEEFTAFLDSTQARFWFHREGVRERVRAALQDHPEGRFLETADLERLRFRFPGREYGEEIFAVREGTVIFPNFFQDSEPPKGMHGYLPEAEANWATAVVVGAAGPPAGPEPFDLTALYPTLLRFLDLPLPGSPAALPVELPPPPTLDLTVLIPTRDRADILGACLDALAADAAGLDGTLEVVVVDDGSTDTSAEVAAAARAAHPALRIQYLRQRPSGPAAARNLGLRQARGALVLFMNDDTLAERGFLAEHLAWHKAHPALGEALLGDLPWDACVAPSPFRGWLLREGPLCALEGLADGALLDYRYFVTANLSVKRAFLARHGRFDEEFRRPMLEDTELGYRLGRQGLQLRLDRRARGRHRHRIDLAGFCGRQEAVGREAYLLLRKHPRLTREILPRLERPLGSAADRPVRDLLRRLAELEEDPGLAEAVRGEASGAMEGLLGRLYLELLDTLRLEGYLAALDEAGAYPAPGAWERLGLPGLAPSLRFLLEETWRARSAAAAPPPPAEAGDLQRVLDDLQGRLHRSGCAYRELEERHKTLLDAYQERQQAVEGLMARLDTLRARPWRILGAALRFWAGRVLNLFGARR